MSGGKFGNEKFDVNPEFSKSETVGCYTLSDYDVWYKPCGNCGYDTGKSTARSRNKCWKCGRPIRRDYSKRALKAGV